MPSHVSIERARRERSRRRIFEAIIFVSFRVWSKSSRKIVAPDVLILPGKYAVPPSSGLLDGGRESRGDA